MVEGLCTRIVQVGVCKGSEAKFMGNEDSLEKFKGDRGAEDTRWDAISFIDDGLIHNKENWTKKSIKV